MKRPCARCGETFDAQRGSARFCSGSCRTAAFAARKAGRPERADGAAPPPVAQLLPAGPSLLASSRLKLEAAGRAETWEGQAALKVAELIDNAKAVMGYAALVREHRAAMELALKPDEAAGRGDVLDEIEASALRVLHGA